MWSGKLHYTQYIAIMLRIMFNMSTKCVTACKVKHNTKKTPKYGAVIGRQAISNWNYGENNLQWVPANRAEK